MMSADTADRDGTGMGAYLLCNRFDRLFGLGAGPDIPPHVWIITPTRTQPIDPKRVPQGGLTDIDDQQSVPLGGSAVAIAERE